MAKFRVDWTEELWYRAVIEADTMEEAQEIFWSGEFDTSDAGNLYNSEIQDSVEFEEVHE